MKLFRIMIAFAMFGIAPVWAQEEAAETAAAEEETVVEEAPAEDTRTHDVWWGNRSHSYGNYLKFDRIQVAAYSPAPAAPAGPVVMDTLQFDRDKSVLNPPARAIVDDAIRILRANPAMTAHIEVRAGAQPLTGSQLSLAQRRTDTVRRYMAENGIASDRISVSSSGTSAASASAVVIPVSGN